MFCPSISEEPEPVQVNESPSSGLEALEPDQLIATLGAIGARLSIVVEHEILSSIPDVICCYDCARQ